MKDKTKLKVAIEAIEQQQRKYVVDRNAYVRQGMEFGRSAAEQWQRLEEAKCMLEDWLAEHEEHEEREKARKKKVKHGEGAS